MESLPDCEVNECVVSKKECMDRNSITNRDSKWGKCSHYYCLFRWM